MSLYRSPGQNEKDDFETSLQNLELNFDHKAEKNPFLIVVLGDFNSKSKSWYTNDSTDFEGLKNGHFNVLSFGSHQFINKLANILNNSSSCIELIFTTQLNLVMESGVHSSLDANCHCQLYVKFNVNVFYPPSYEREVWHYELTNSHRIQRGIKNFDCEKAFVKVDVNKKELLFNETIILLEIVKCNDRDPPWILIKKVINSINLFH